MKKEIQGVQNFDKDPMNSNQQTVTHNPDKFILDFKNIFPQFTPNNDPTLVINHKTILLEPHVLKSFTEILKTNIKKYEEKFGKIKVPESIKTAEKEAKKSNKKEVDSTFKPSYSG